MDCLDAKVSTEEGKSTIWLRNLRQTLTMKQHRLKQRLFPKTAAVLLVQDRFTRRME